MGYMYCTESRQNMTFQIQEAMSSPTHAQDSLHLTSEAGLASMGRSFAWVEAFFSTSAVPGQQAMVKTRFAMSQIETCRSAQSSHILVPLNVWALQICLDPVGFNCLDPSLGEFAVALAAPFMVYYIMDIDFLSLILPNFLA